MIDSMRILNEPNPYLREILAAGYDRVMEDLMGNCLKLIRTSDQYIKEVPRIKLTEIFTIKTAILYSGEKHSWISEADGSADRFRKIIESCT